MPNIPRDVRIACARYHRCWRGARADTARTYVRWCRATPGDRALAYAAFVAALDREELAADHYRRMVAFARAVGARP